MFTDAGPVVGVVVDVGVSVAIGVSGVGVGVGVGKPPTVKHAENSEVDPGDGAIPREADGRTPLASGDGPISVAVAVRICPGTTTDGTVTEKVAFPLPSVVTLAGVGSPRNVWPSPFPEGSQTAFEKNCRRKDVFAALLRIP
jgi:hypothetical protein